MSIPGYDAWKLASPDEDRSDALCPLCGSYSPRQCELEEETGGFCPWEECEPDPDDIRSLRAEDALFDRDNSRNGDDF